ncbi:Shedu anti-phage system protein SduA domain-containing protein [Acetobacterium sp. UBA5834]|jgi:hypothetical protein|uniref:Shedu anti-phage system protein SduA domain-containing protein n=1 Tax=Acetobacterium sp. UBA5834 TaxID=1945907 RepID=UPI00257DE26F|nr:Shedu anti-phage system protein SduA domain-containing protein [Acetobacterium sp. UBA5834]
MYTYEQIEELLKSIVDDLNNKVFNLIDNFLELYPEKRNSLNPAFPFPKKIKVGVLKKFLVVEYCGPEDPLDSKIEAEAYFNPEASILDFIGVDLGKANILSLPVNQPVENFSFFLGKSISYLCDYLYDFTQLPSEYIVMNGLFNFEPLNNETTYISNISFFWSNNEDRLMLKHIDFMEIIPLLEDGIGYHTEESYKKLAEFLIFNNVPQYRVQLHRALNEFIELISLDATKEVDITNFLEANPEILQYSFGTNKLNPQILLEWQYDCEMHDLKPDFMPVRMDGFCDIFEFKLPHLNSKSFVGSNVRQHPSYSIDEAIAQLNCYHEWCSQLVNTEWLEKNKGIKILNPQRYLIMGHSKDFTPEQRRKLREQRNVTIFTYDEFIELARFQIYRFR